MEEDEVPAISCCLLPAGGVQCAVLTCATVILGLVAAGGWPPPHSAPTQHTDTPNTPHPAGTTRPTDQLTIRPTSRPADQHNRPTCPGRDLPDRVGPSQLSLQPTRARSDQGKVQGPAVQGTPQPQWADKVIPVIEPLFQVTGVLPVTFSITQIKKGHQAQCATDQKNYKHFHRDGCLRPYTGLVGCSFRGWLVGGLEGGFYVDAILSGWRRQVPAIRPVC